MPHPNEDLVRRMYEAFAQSDLPTVAQLMHPEIVFNVPGRSPYAGVYRGMEEVAGLLMKQFELSGGTVKLEVHDVLANDEHATALVTATATRNGQPWTMPEVHVFHFRDGKASEYWEHPADQYSVDEFWG